MYEPIIEQAASETIIIISDIGILARHGKLTFVGVMIVR